MSRKTKKMDEQKIIVGITQGDVNGIGYEVIIKALADNRILEICTPVIYGSPKVAAYHRKVLEIENLSFNQIPSAEEIDHRKINIVNCCDDEIRVELGKSTPEAGQAAFEALEAATNDLRAGLIDVLVTAPINKDNIQSETFHFPGHTEYLAKKFDSKNYLMLLVSEGFRVGVVTGHVSVSSVSEMITEQSILRKLRVLQKSLISDFAVTAPRIAVLGLNPHNGDNGVIGKEENDIIIPALRKANNEGITALGPYSADGFFGSGLHKKFDAVLAMYHDQGLIPFKTLTFDMGVNFTAGLPIVRTSPDHGTAYDIAGENKASEQSMLQAIYLALDIFRNRQNHEEASSNPLQKYEINTSGESDDVNLMNVPELDDF